ncbi:MAG: YdcF family protein [Rhodospirillales bacterium]|nr:YdcF family protein [Rhodospirillales bacterium]
MDRTEHQPALADAPAPSPVRRAFRHPAFGILLAGVLGAGALWAAGLLWFAASIPTAVRDAATRTDAIVVLTGGSGRLDTALALLADDRAKTLFVSGVHQGVAVRRLLEAVNLSPLELGLRISVGTAANTEENAAETSEWVARESIKSIRLVTAAYHMPRSLAEFRRVMPGLVVIPHPVFPDHVKQERWWAWPGTASLIASEYHKYLFARARHLVMTVVASA